MLSHHHSSLGGSVGGFAVAAVLAAAVPVAGLIVVIPDSRPWHNDSTPLGAEEVANLPGRLGRTALRRGRVPLLVPPPRMDVYRREGGPIDWSKVRGMVQRGR